MARCKSCGVELRTGARFCDMCGAKVEKICPNCGEVLRAQAKFCDLCGEKLPLAQLISRPKVHGDICAGRLHTVALKEDGTLLATGDNQFGQCDVADWTDVVAVAAGKYHTVAVRSDGTALATGDRTYGQCDIGDWTDIVAVAAGDSHTVGLPDRRHRDCGWPGFFWKVRFRKLEKYHRRSSRYGSHIGPVSGRHRFSCGGGPFWFLRG